MADPDPSRKQITDWSLYLTESKIYFNEMWSKKFKSSLKRSDFNFIGTLSKGSFGRVDLASRNDVYYAVKVIRLSRIEHRNIRHVTDEKSTLQASKFPFLIHMEHYFSDKDNLYFVMPYISGGDFWTYLRKRKKLSESDTKFYSSQVLLALEYLHYMGIAHRDLKPENILIGPDGYIKLGDLGFCKRIDSRAYTFCGTIEYIAPEVFFNQGYGLGVDWWSFGVLLYEMCAGYTPFVGLKTERTIENITSGKFNMCKEFSHQLQGLIGSILQLDVTLRLGNLSEGSDDIKSHPWFRGCDWLAILNKQVLPPFLPETVHPKVTQEESDDDNYDSF